MVIPGIAELIIPRPPSTVKLPDTSNLELDAVVPIPTLPFVFRFIDEVAIGVLDGPPIKTYPWVALITDWKPKVLVADQAGAPPDMLSTVPVAPEAKVFIVPSAEKYGRLPVATADQFCPVPPRVVEMAVPFQMPVVMVPKVVIVVEPMFDSIAIVPNPKLVLAVELELRSERLEAIFR